MNSVPLSTVITAGRRTIRRGSFRTVRELIRRIEHFVSHYNEGARPFVATPL